MGRFERIEAWSSEDREHATLDWKDPLDAAPVQAIAYRQHDKVLRRIVEANTFRSAVWLDAEFREVAKHTFNSYWTVVMAYQRLGWPELKAKPWPEIIDVPADAKLRKGDSFIAWQGLALEQSEYALNTTCLATLALNRLQCIRKPEARIHNQVAALLRKECDALLDCQERMLKIGADA